LVASARDLSLNTSATHLGSSKSPFPTGRLIDVALQPQRRAQWRLGAIGASSARSERAYLVATAVGPSHDVLPRPNFFHTNANSMCYNVHVKGDQIGEFEELLLLAVLAMAETPCVVPIQQYLERATARHVSLGAVYAGLDRLERKGLVTSSFSHPTPVRGGKRKRMFEATRRGLRTAQTVRRVRDAIWKVIEERQ